MAGSFSIGPLAQVDTSVAGINFDVSRLLNWGKALVLEFITEDRTEPDGWFVVATFTKGFDRVPADEKQDGDGSDVIFGVADPTLIMPDILRSKNLHVRVDGSIFQVAKAPPVAPTVAQVYTLTCKVRTLKTNFDTTRK